MPLRPNSVIVAGIAAMHHGSIRQTDDPDVCHATSVLSG